MKPFQIQSTSERSTATSNTSPEVRRQALLHSHEEVRRLNQGRIAARAYELYEERGRQEGRAVEDWLNAERQLVGAAGKP